jgi:glycosyltransferase involved in cell wall biosynthesis
VLTVSRITAKNNLELLLRGFAAALKRRGDLRLVIVGGVKPSGLAREEAEYYSRVLRLVRDLQISSHVTFAGWKLGEELWEHYRTADVFAWTSRSDNFARALVEAAWFGLPIVSTSVGVAPELLADGRGGRLIGHDDPEGLADAITALANGGLSTKNDARQNHEKAAQYTVDRMVGGYIDLYHRLVAA